MAVSSTHDVEKDLEEMEEEQFSGITRCMIENVAKRRALFETYTTDDSDDPQPYSPSCNTPRKKRRCAEEYNDNISASPEFVELEQERRLIRTSLEQVKKDGMFLSRDATMCLAR